MNPERKYSRRDVLGAAVAGGLWGKIIGDRIEESAVLSERSRESAESTLGARFGALPAPDSTWYDNQGQIEKGYVHHNETFIAFMERFNQEEGFEITNPQLDLGEATIDLIFHLGQAPLRIELIAITMAPQYPVVSYNWFKLLMLQFISENEV